MAPTGVRVVEQALHAWNAGELEGPLAAKLSRLGPPPIQLTDYRTVGTKVVAALGDRTLVFTIKNSEIGGIEVFEPGQRLPDELKY